MKIYVGGSLQRVARDPDACQQFVAALGAEVVRRGHVLLNGCRSSLDREIAAGANSWLVDNGRNPKEYIFGYHLKGDPPAHNFGAVRPSRLEDWQMTHVEYRVPEQIDRAAATIFVAGNEGTFWSKNWASAARKLVVGIPHFGGAGETIYNNELDRLRAKEPDLADDYETLSSTADDMNTYAEDVLGFVERLVTPRSVFSVMSYKPEYFDVFDSYKVTCAEFGFTAVRTDEEDSLERILPRIEAGIRTSAFIIADVTEASPNVFYEVGYARALGKKVILTARKDTKLPFDVHDIPVTSWESPPDLQALLRKRLAGVVSQLQK